MSNPNIKPGKRDLHVVISFKYEVNFMEAWCAEFDAINFF